jgi:hypothetical protein
MYMWCVHKADRKMFLILRPFPNAETFNFRGTTIKHVYTRAPAHEGILQTTSP